MVSGLYSVMALVGAVVLVVIQRITVELKMRGDSGRIFSRVAGVSAFFCLCDAIWGFFASRAIPSERLYFGIASVVFHIMATFVAYVWAMYTFSYLNIKLTRLLRVVMVIPFVFATSFLLFTLSWSYVFNISLDMKYTLGPYRMILFIVQFGYLICAIVVAVTVLLKQKNRDSVWQRRIQGICSYLLFPLVFGNLQEVYPYAPFYALGFMLSGVVAFTGINVREEEYRLQEKSDKFENQSKEIYNALEALSKSFVSIHLFDLRYNRQNSVKSTPNIDAFIDPNDDGATQIKKVMRGVAADRYKQIMEDFVDLKTLPGRMRGRGKISQEFQGVNEGWCASSFITVETGEDNRPTKVIHVVQNIDEAKRREKEYMEALKAALENQNIIYAEMLTAQKNGVVALDTSDKIVKLNNAAARIFGYPSADDVPNGTTLERMMKRAGAVMENPAEFYESYRIMNHTGEPYDYVFSIGEDNMKKYYRAQVNTFELMDGSGMYIVSQADITESKRTENALRIMSETDSLTGLNNRGSGEKKIGEKLQEESHGVFFLFDINKFKQINDTYGHHIGDEALINVAICLKRAFLKEDIVMRLGGDEFAAFVSDIATEDGVMVCIDKLIELINGIEMEDAPDCKVTISIGAIMLKDAEERTFDCLYKHADSLMYECKAREGIESKYAIYRD